MCVFVFAQVLMQTTCWYKYTQSTIVNQKHTMYVYIKYTNQISTGHNNRYTGKCQPINVWNTTIVMANVNTECVDYNCYHGKCQPMNMWITTVTMANINPLVCGLQLISWQMSTHECVDYKCLVLFGQSIASLWLATHCIGYTMLVFMFKWR